MKEEFKTSEVQEDDFSGAFFDDDQMAQLNSQGDVNMFS